MKKLMVTAVVLITLLIFVGDVLAKDAGMPNPADIYCEELGYQSDVIRSKDGGTHTICIFPDGSSCDTWQFFEGKCGEAYSYCSKHNYRQVTKTDGKNPFSSHYAVCVDKKGKEVGPVTDLMGLKRRYERRYEKQSGPTIKKSSLSKTGFTELSVSPTAGVSPLPTSFDWRNNSGQNWMTPVHNQRGCGSCWAFSAVGATEAVYNIHTNNPNLDMDLSEEYLISDCDSAISGTDRGSCCGGDHGAALSFIRDYGIPDESCMVNDESYYGSRCGCFGLPACDPLCGGLPFSCSKLACDDKCIDSAQRLIKIAGYDSVPQDRDQIKQRLIEKGPLAVCLAMSGRFTNNVYECTRCWDHNNNNICDTGPGTCTNNSCTAGSIGAWCDDNGDCVEDRNSDGNCNENDCGTNHCVVLVGYNDAGNYWILKNSWGDTWGQGETWFQNGYFNIGYNDECHVEEAVLSVNPLDIQLPIISVPGDITFADTCAGETSSETLNVCNTGQADLRIDSISSSDAQFVVTTPSQGYTLVVSPDFCYPFQATFSPASTGTKTATLTIMSSNHSVEVQATGIGTQNDIGAFIADSGNFGDVCVGSQKDLDLTISNSGGCQLTVTGITSDSGQFQVAGGVVFPLNISAGGNIQVPIRFQPSSSGSKSANITIASNDPDMPNKVVHVTGNVPTSAISTAIPNTGNFGDVCVGSFKDMPLTINNAGGCNLSISGITSSSGEFVSPGITFPLTVSPGSSTSVMIRFQPSGLGSKSANMSITSNAPSSPTTVAVSGNVSPGDIRVTGSTDFGDVCAETQAEKTIRVCNVGKCNLNVTGAAFSPACGDFQLVSNPFPAAVSPDSCVDAVIRFTPSSQGAKSCTLVVSSDDPDTPSATLTVTANTPAASIDVSPDQTFLPTVIQSIDACQSQKPFPISNTGKCNLYITDLSITDNSAEYSLAGRPSLPIILEPGHIAGGGDLMTVFEPTVIERDRSGQLTVTYESDPITHTASSVTRQLCGEAVMTGARVLVTVNGVPVDTVKKIQIQRLGGNRNKKIVDTVDVAQNVPLMTVTPGAPCLPFQYHREYGTVSNPIQLIPGSYQVTVMTAVNGKNKSKTVSFSVGTCDFNPNIVIDF